MDATEALEAEAFVARRHGRRQLRKGGQKSAAGDAGLAPWAVTADRASAASEAAAETLTQAAAATGDAGSTARAKTAATKNSRGGNDGLIATCGSGFFGSCSYKGGD